MERRSACACDSRRHRPRRPGAISDDAHEDFRHISDEDVASIVVYLRSLPPVHDHLSKTEVGFPVKYLIRSVPEPLTSPVAAPDPADCVKYGRYLVKIDGCADCHTRKIRGNPSPDSSSPAAG